MGDQLVDFFRNKKQQPTNQEIDWQAKRDSWLHSVDDLYARVQDMLRDSLASKDITVRTFETQVTEDLIGTYAVPGLEIAVGDERVEFRAQGRDCDWCFRSCGHPRRTRHGDTSKG